MFNYVNKTVIESYDLSLWKYPRYEVLYEKKKYRINIFNLKGNKDSIIFAISLKKIYLYFFIKLFIFIFFHIFIIKIYSFQNIFMIRFNNKTIEMIIVHNCFSSDNSTINRLIHLM